MGSSEPVIHATCPHCGHALQLSLSSPEPSLPTVAVAPTAAPTPSVASPVTRIGTAVPLTSAVRSPPTAPTSSAALPPGRASRGVGKRARVAARWRNFPPVRIWKRYFPPVRLVWIFLAILIWNADGFVGRAVAWPLLALPVAAVVTDLGLQLARFPRLRFPDAAIANGLFLAVILWPATVSIELTAVAVATVGLRHLMRVAGHPILNPAALGVTLAATVFAIPQPWHVGLTLHDTILVAALGLILWSRAWHTWRLWAVFFATNVTATLLLADYLAGSSVLPLVIQTSVLGAAPVFYGFFMVSEPRTAPSNRRAMVVFGGLVGISSAVFPILFAEYPQMLALGVLTPYLALFLGNLFAVALPSARGARRPSTSRPQQGDRKTVVGRTSGEPSA